MRNKMCIRDSYYLIEKTKFGYELKACGYNRDAARYLSLIHI